MWLSLKLFNRSKNDVHDIVYYDESDQDKIDKLEKLFEKASQKKAAEQKVEHLMLVNDLKLLSDQIKAAKEEYENVMIELMPVKWELLEKKTQILELQSDYEVILSRIKQAKLELEPINIKINSVDRSNSNEFKE